MKTKFKFLMAIAALAVGFTGCSNENDGGVAFDGKSTGLKISIPKVSTYTDANATTPEVAFRSATIFVYNGNILEKDTTVLVSGFAQNGSKYEMIKPINVLSGSKNVYVGLNLSTADIAAVRAGLQAPYTVLVSDITKTNGFAMFSMNGDNTFNILVDDTTEITVPVERWVAKVTSRVSASINSEASGATITDFSFALGQVNTKMFPFQKLLQTGIVEDPNWSGYQFNGTGAYGPSDFVNEFGTNGSIITAAYKPVNAFGTSIADLATKYALENTSEGSKRGEATYISVRAKFVPNAYHTYIGTTLAAETATGTVPENLYVVEAEGGIMYYFKDKTQADNYADFISGKVGHYKNGLCYYFVFLDANKAPNSYAVLRNTYYDSVLTKVNSLGYPDPEVTEPDLPLAKYTKLEVDVLIQPWEVVLSEDELGRI